MKQVVYVANSDSKQIQVISINHKKILNLIQTIEVHGQIQPLKIIKKYKILYAGIRPNFHILVFKISSNGTLKKISKIYITNSINHISSDFYKKYLFCSSYHGNCLTIISLNDKGIPKDNLQIINNINGCHFSKVVGKNNFLCVTSLKNDSINLYKFVNHQRVILKQHIIIKTSKNSGPRHIVIHPNINIMYSINELTGNIDVWKIDLNLNILNFLKSININYINSKNNFWSADIHITTSGKYLYTTDRMHNIISLFKVHLNGDISNIKNYKTEIQPRSFYIDYYDKYLIVAGEISNKLTIYKITNNGYLKFLMDFKVGKRPIWVLIYKLNNN
ncbi:beta-propeller fold lactonase family protein [Buchnera aphidicola (Neophyllaphis podocarpi)]|uniref:beta-propeller fold lactonase family protein n=1 Tax=Buchnera aphidicola TaxID=9 RepID=UPI0031B82C9B